MNIVAADWLAYELPLMRPWRTSRGEITERTGRLLRLQAVDGCIGWGDSAPLPEFDIPRTAADAFAEETAQLDLIAQRSGLPLHQWLSGKAHIPCLKVNANLGSLADTTPVMVKRAAEQGFKVIKLKLGIASVSDDIARLKELSTDTPPGIRWRLDANRAWCPADAQAFILGCTGLPIESLEEPLTDPDHSALGRLQSMAPWPIAIDESIQLIDERFFRHPPIRRLVIKPARHGGLLASVELALRARASDIEVIVTSSLESACGLAACAQLAAAVAPEATHGLATGDWFAVDTGGTFPIAAGRMQLPVAAGLGFTSHSSYAPFRSGA